MNGNSGSCSKKCSVAPYGRALAHDQGLTKLHGMTVVEALAAGEEPRVVWNVLCGQMDVPDAKRWGRDHNAPPLPVDFH